MNDAFLNQKLKKDILKWVFEAKAYHHRRIEETSEYVQRYKAKRSIAGLMGWGEDPKANPKNYPWDFASDVGIPLEAFTIEGLLPRFMKVCFGADPIVWVSGNTDEEIQQAPIVQDALNYQVKKIIKIYRKMKMCYKNTVMDGDGIVKCVWEVKHKIVPRTVFYAIDTVTGDYLTEEGQQEPIEFGRNEAIPEVSPNGFPLKKVRHILSEKIVTYDNPQIYSRNIKQIVVPKNADTPFIEDLDWIADQYERSLDWVKRRIGDTEEGKFDEAAVNELEQMVTNSVNNKSKRVLITEWHGNYDINGDGYEEEIIVFLATKDLVHSFYADKYNPPIESVLLGWTTSSYIRRPFFHYQIIPMDGSFYGIGVPEFLIGIRNVVDAIFNQMIDRGSINNNPPIITPSDHDPDENPFGPGAIWSSDNPNAYRVLDLPKSEQVEFIKMEFLLALVQKLFGVTDYSLGTESTIASNRTATGILSIIGEGNVKFEDMIRSLQDINEDLYDFIVQLNSEFLEDDIVYRITGSQENPFKRAGRKDFKGRFNFEAVGNSININREIEQNRASVAYKTAIDSFGKNPAITEEVLLTLTRNFFRSIDMRNVKLPTIEELKQRKIQEISQAIQIARQQGAQNGTAVPPGQQF